MPRTYAPELKAQVIAEWKAGSSLGGCSRAFSVPLTTVASWVKGESRLPVELQQPKQKPEPYNLDQMAVKLVDGSVHAVSAIHGIAQEHEWLQKQNAADLGVLLGIISDKLYRLLEAIRPYRAEPAAGAAVITAGSGEDS